MDVVFGNAQTASDLEESRRNAIEASSTIDTKNLHPGQVDEVEESI